MRVPLPPLLLEFGKLVSSTCELAGSKTSWILVCVSSNYRRFLQVRVFLFTNKDTDAYIFLRNTKTLNPSSVWPLHFFNQSVILHFGQSIFLNQYKAKLHFGPIVISFGPSTFLTNKKAHPYLVGSSTFFTPIKDPCSTLDPPIYQ